MQKLNLSGIWKLRGEFLDVTAKDVIEVTEREEGTFGIEFSDKGPFPFPYRVGYMEAKVPGDVVEPLIENNILKDPLLRDNSKDAVWVKDLSWWYIREFTVDEELLKEEEVRLFIEMLDYHADIIINHRIAGQHRNTFVPYDQDVKRFLKAGSNQLVIRLTSGVEEYHDRDSISFYCMNSNPLCNQRIYLRKPQYTYGWDWCKSLPTCGIGGEICLEGFSGAKVTAFRADTLKISGKSAELKMFFEIEKLRMSQAEEVIVHYQICDGDIVLYEKVMQEYLIGGLNFIEDEVTLEQISLWWPNGYGEPKLYQVKADISCRNDIYHMKEREIGIRTVSLDHSKREDGTRNYAIFVNGVKIWCKGGNWVPADSYYLRIPEHTYQTLIEEAREANFTMLRIWGGGLYEPDFFYKECSRKGILILHDFMYACAFYPDHKPWFLHQAMLEAEYQTKRLAHYPCMAIWSGNNEIHESITEWFPDSIMPEQFYGAKIFNYVQPKSVKDNAPMIPYVPGSPYFGTLPNDMDSGDSHIWKWMRSAEETKMHYHFELESFDKLKTRFSSEYGFHGALMPSSVKRYHDGEGMDVKSPVWINHGEHQGKRQVILNGIRRHLCELEEEDVQQYLLYSGVLQGSLYEQLANTLRSKNYCSGNLIWMYNDCWPETGWTIIDYYLTRKISYYYLKRAFEPTKFIIKKDNGRVRFLIINETDQKRELSLEYGYLTFCGMKEQMQEAFVTVDCHSAYEFEVSDTINNGENGCYYIKSRNDTAFMTATDVVPYYRDLMLSPCRIVVTMMDQTKDYTEVKVVSDSYVPVAYLCTEDDRTHYSDNYFELIPGEEKLVKIYAVIKKVSVHQLLIDRR